jgi:hypothetical protein
MRSVTLILGCCLVLILRKFDWNELIGHPKDHGKDQLNSRTNSLQPGEDDADQKIVRSSSVTVIDPTIDRSIERTPVIDRTTPVNDCRTCAQMSKPFMEATDEGRSIA